MRPHVQRAVSVPATTFGDSQVDAERGVVDEVALRPFLASLVLSVSGRWIRERVGRHFACGRRRS